MTKLYLYDEIREREEDQRGYMKNGLNFKKKEPRSLDHDAVT